MSNQEKWIDLSSFTSELVGHDGCLISCGRYCWRSFSSYRFKEAQRSLRSSLWAYFNRFLGRFNVARVTQIAFLPNAKVPSNMLCHCMMWMLFISWDYCGAFWHH